MFGPNWEEITERGRKLHDEYLNALNSSPDIIAMMMSKKIRSVVHVSRIGERREFIQTFGEKTCSKDI
jgi:hypothetical protein